MRCWRVGGCDEEEEEEYQGEKQPKTKSTGGWLLEKVAGHVVRDSSGWQAQGVDTGVHTLAMSREFWVIVVDATLLYIAASGLPRNW